MKKLMLNVLLFFIGASTCIFAQGFVGNGTNLFLVNSSGSATLSPFPKIGLGTSSPTAQLHTTQTVRFQGLTNNNSLSRIIVSDANGNLSFRDANTLTGNFWGLTGNSISSSDFIGTTNAQPFAIRTNNIERMRITPTGFLGIGTDNPTDKIHVVDNVNSTMRFQSSGGYAGITLQGQGSSDAHSYISLENTNSTSRWLISHRLVTQNNSLFFSYFNGTQWKEQISFSQYDANNVGLGLGTTTPTAKLHTNGNIRFENLPDDLGVFILTVDNQGNVYKTDAGNMLLDNSNNTEYLLERILHLEEKLRRIQPNTNSIDNTNILFQNHPNPSNDGTTIRYSISNTDNSYINIYNYNGVKVKEYKLDNNYGNIEILKNDLNSGSYIYTLYVNGIIIDSKKLIFQ